jgi:O-methyltransferase
MALLLWPPKALRMVRDLERQVEDTFVWANSLAARLLENDGITVADRNLHFREDDNLKAAWAFAEQANAAGWAGNVPDIRWRAHIALWAARNCQHLQGDFVECGVHTGLLSLTICHGLDFARQPRKFWLFDTFNGIPLDQLEGKELARCEASNQDFYRDVLALARANFAPFPNAVLVPGVLPQSLDQASLDRIAYLSMDLNVAHYERQVIERLWDRLVSGAIVLIDDYDWKGYEKQRDSWNDFTASKGHFIATLPTGQGLLIKR